MAQVEARHSARLRRKYATLLSSMAAAMPIASLSYFATIIEEVVTQPNTSDTYWAYVRRKAAALEREWTSYIRGRTRRKNATTTSRTAAAGG